MPNQATTLVGQATGWRRLKAFICLVLVALTGCFGPSTMHYDIQEYNKQIVSSEQEMLLYNIGRLNRKLPPHFMMLSSVSQTRMFSGSGSFQWSQMLSALAPTTMFAHTIGNSLSAQTKTTTTANPTIESGGNWQAGPFAAGAVENPTITFFPIQGQDFANRFESTLTDKFLLFSEDM